MYLQLGWWTFRLEDKRLEWYNRRVEGWKWKDRQWCWCKRAARAVSVSLLCSRTIKDSDDWGRFRPNQEPTAELGANDPIDLLGLIPWKRLFSGCNTLISNLCSASWSLLEYPQLPSRKSIQSVNQKKKMTSWKFRCGCGRVCLIIVNNSGLSNYYLKFRL